MRRKLERGFYPCRVQPVQVVHRTDIFRFLRWDEEVRIKLDVYCSCEKRRCKEICVSLNIRAGFQMIRQVVDDVNGGGDEAEEDESGKGA